MDVRGQMNRALAFDRIPAGRVGGAGELDTESDLLNCVTNL